MRYKRDGFGKARFTGRSAAHETERRANGAGRRPHEAGLQSIPRGFYAIFRNAMWLKGPSLFGRFRDRSVP